MKKFRDMIARRRPSRPVSEDQRDMDAAQDAPETSAPKRGQADPHTGKTLDIDRAKAARDSVPRPKTPRVMSAKAPKIWDIEFDSDLARALDGDLPIEDVRSEPSVPMTSRAPAPQTPAPHPPAPQALAAQPQLTPPAASPTPLKTSAPMAGTPTGRRQQAVDRAKTRLLGFGGEAATPDVFQAAPADTPPPAIFFPVGWLVVVNGPGRGASFTLTAGLNTVGRDASQTVSLDFGDASISRENHAAIAYDEEENLIFVGHGGKSNIVRLNGKPLLTTEELKDGDRLRIGKTELQFLAYCKDGISWGEESSPDSGAAHG